MLENVGIPANELFVLTIERRFGCPLLLPCGHWPSGLNSTLAVNPWMCHVAAILSGVFQHVDLYQAHINAPAFIVGNMGAMMGHLPGFVGVTLSLSHKGTDGSSSLHP